ERGDLEGSASGGGEGGGGGSGRVGGGPDSRRRSSGRHRAGNMAGGSPHSHAGADLPGQARSPRRHRCRDHRGAERDRSLVRLATAGVAGSGKRMGRGRWSGAGGSERKREGANGGQRRSA